MNRLVVLWLGAVVVVSGWSAAAVADEAKSQISASMLLRISAPISESREAAFDRAMKEPAAAPRRADGEVQPDGSVRYGSMVVTVRNPCPPGAHYEPFPLPGRVRK
jgi:hypothetical protein